jgi:hypothetical protein
MAMNERTFLKLAALDEDDLTVISAHMQDAVARLGDVSFSPRRKQFALVANRFNWDEHLGRAKKTGERRRTGLHFNRVLAARSQHMRQGNPDAIVSLLAITFTPGKHAPAGTVDLTFAGGGLIRLEVECIEASLEDLGPIWQTPNVPDHGEA